MYEVLMAILAVIAVAIAFLDIAGRLPHGAWIAVLELVIWGIFVVDYLVRLVVAESKKQYFKENLFDLVAILPFSSVLRVFRFVRIFRLAKLARLTKMTKLVRLFAAFGRFGTKASKFLSTNGFIYVLYINAAIILLGAIGIFFTESGETVYSFPDAIWWSFVTATTVGYGDISPSTIIGRLIAVVLMLAGIGTIGMLTSTLSTYFIRDKGSSSASSDDIDDLKKELENLNSEQIRVLRDIIKNFK